MPLLHAVQLEAGQKPEQQQAAQAEPDRSQNSLESLQEKMGAAGLTDGGDRPASLAASASAPVPQPQTSRFEQVFAQSQVQMPSALFEGTCRTLLPFVWLAHNDHSHASYCSLMSWLTLVDRSPCYIPHPGPF